MVEGKRLLFIVVLVMVFLLSSCQREDDEVLLRFTPQVGRTYPYRFEVYRSHDPVVVTGEMHVLSKDEDRYGIRFSGTLGDELLSRLMVVTDRHNSNDPGYISLNLPEDPVRPEAEWSGEIPWYYEDNYVLDSSEIYLPASYELLRIEETADGKVAFVEQTVEADVAVDGLVLHVGQVGVQWDHAGRITQVHPEYDASGKLRVGDLVVGING